MPVQPISSLVVCLQKRGESCFVDVEVKSHTMVNSAENGCSCVWGEFCNYAGTWC